MHVASEEGMTAIMKWLIAILYCVALFSGQSQASEPTPYPDPVNETRPAVDGVNGKLSIEGGQTFGGGEAYGISGSVAMPLGHQLGLQVDGAAGTFEGSAIDDAQVFAGAAHLFWRDPSRGLLGVYGGVIHADALNDFNVRMFGLEGASYLGRLTVEGVVGISHTEAFGSDAFADVELAYYPDDNMRLDTGYSVVSDSHVFKLGGEWAFAGQAGAVSSAFVDGYVNDNGDGLAVAGLRFYFGQSDKSLIRRHREDDPPAYPQYPFWSAIIGGVVP